VQSIGAAVASGYPTGAVGFFDRFRRGSTRREREGLARVAREAHEHEALAREARVAEARRHERAGDLEGAVEAYLAAGLPNGAARVLMLRADAEPSAAKRLAFCEQAAQLATIEKLHQQARHRRALIELDVLRADDGSVLASELVDVARRLEACGELGRAAQAYLRACETEEAVRVLTQLGVMEEIGDIFTFERDTWTEQKVDAILQHVTELDAAAERYHALRLVRAMLCEIYDAPETHRNYAAHARRLVAAARAIRAQLLSSPVVDLEIDGLVRRCVLGSEVIIGREDCTLVSWSSRVSRHHLRIARGPDGVFVEDLETSNGTRFADGTPLTGRVVVRAPLVVWLADAPCAIEPAPSGIFITLSEARRYFAPVGDLVVSGWRIGYDATGPCVRLVTPRSSARPHLGLQPMSAQIELSRGDAFSTEPGGPIRLRIPPNSDVFA
jgi:hypothetical protein